MKIACKITKRAKIEVIHNYTDIRFIITIIMSLQLYVLYKSNVIP